jgi:hypothetical protein
MERMPDHSEVLPGSVARHLRLTARASLTASVIDCSSDTNFAGVGLIPDLQ